MTKEQNKWKKRLYKSKGIDIKRLYFIVMTLQNKTIKKLVDDYYKRNKHANLFYATLGIEAYYQKTTKGYSVDKYLIDWVGVF